MRAWLYGIATNLIAQHRRAEQRRYRAWRAPRPSQLPAATRTACVVGAAAGMQPQLAQALARLSPEERDVVLLVALADLSHEEISQALDIPYGTVGSRLNRARKKIRAALDQEGQIDE